MAPCKTLTTTLDMESESTDTIKGRTRSRTKKVTTDPSNTQELMPTKKVTKVQRSLDLSEPLTVEKKSVKPRRSCKKTDSTESTSTDLQDTTLSNTQEKITTPKADDKPIKKELTDFYITQNVQTILLAIKENKAVELCFIDTESNQPRTFEPRQLIFDTFAKDWYIWGWDRRYNTERHHLISLIDNINIINGIGRSAQGPYKDDTPANYIGGWIGGESIHVKLVILKQWIFAVRQAPLPFPEFKIEDLEEGRAQVTFTATDLRSIARWVMQFGDGVQILEPQRLVDRIKQVGLSWSNKSVSNHIPKAAQIKQEQRPERKLDCKVDTKPQIFHDRKTLEQHKPNREGTEGTKTSKIEIRTGRL